MDLIHRLDTRAGGYPHDIVGYADSGVNRAIGGQWGGSRQLWRQIQPGRIHQLEDYKRAIGA